MLLQTLTSHTLSAHTYYTLTPSSSKYFTLTLTLSSLIPSKLHLLTPHLPHTLNHHTPTPSLILFSPTHVTLTLSTITYLNPDTSISSYSSSHLHYRFTSLSFPRHVPTDTKTVIMPYGMLPLYPHFNPFTINISH